MLSKSYELESLNMTLKRHEWGKFEELQKVVIERIRMERADPKDITLWVTKMIQGIVGCNVAERKGLG